MAFTQEHSTDFNSHMFPLSNTHHLNISLPVKLLLIGLSELR